MNRQIHSTLRLAAVFGLFCAGTAVAGDWEDERAITQDPVLQYRSYIATAPDDTVYVLWPDWTVWEDTQVMLMKSTDRGHSWSEPAVIFGGLTYDNFALAVDDVGVHVVLVEFYEDDDGEYLWPYYTRSVDGGETFSTPVRIGTGEGVQDVALFSDSGLLFAYLKNYNIDDDMYYNYLYVSDDGGATWQEKLVGLGGVADNPAFTVYNGVIHVVWAGQTSERAILHSQSADAGDTWSPAVAVSSGAGPHSQLPQVVVDDGAIHVSWEDDRRGHFNVMYSRSTDGGETWSNDVQLNDTYYGARAQLLTDEEGLHAVWCQYHGDDGWPGTWSSADYGIIWYKFSADGGESWTDEFRVSQNESIPPIDLPDQGANYVKLAKYSNGFGALWQDKRDGNIDLYLRNNLGTPCAGDLDGDGQTGQSDLGILLADWGCSGGDCVGDLDGDGSTGQSDLGILLADWGCGS